MQKNGNYFKERNYLILFNIKIIIILISFYYLLNCQIFKSDNKSDNSKLLLGLLYLNSNFENYFNSAEIYDPNLNQFRLLNNRMHNNRVGHAMTLLQNGKVLITGGSNDTEGSLSTAELYDPITESFSSLPNMSEKRNIHTQTLLKDGRVLIVGGKCISRESSSTIVEVFDPINSTFIAIGSINYPRCSHSTSALEDGSIIIIGGINSLTGSPLKEIEKYNFSDSTITKVADLLNPRTAGVRSIEVSNDKIAIIGGNDGYEDLKTIEIFNGNTSSMEIGNELNFKRNRPDIVKLQDGRILITSGVLNDKSVVITSELLNPVTLAVSKVDSILNFPSDVRQPILLNNNKILLSGGYNKSKGGTQNQSEFFDVESSQFTIGPSLNRARHGQIGVKLQDGKVLVTGGRDLR